MQNQLYMPQEALAAFSRLKVQLQPLLHLQSSNLCDRDRDLFETRLERFFVDFYEPLAKLYQARPDFEQHLAAIGEQLVTAYALRSVELKRLDLEREITPDWFQRETMAGGIYYVDRFAGTLTGVMKHLDYIHELGLNYIHLMPLLKPRSGFSDGGYAVEDYYQVNPALGTMADLEKLTAALHQQGMSLCIDLVLNHTAKEHEWAKRAMAGEQSYLDYYLTFDDRTLPDAYERTLPQVFPDFKPGNFTFYPQMAGGPGKWVWTTFNEFQWDLNYTNPAVFRGMLDYMLFLANRGVDILRLDAVPFMWKRLGTNCQNQPEVHDLLQAFRALVRIVAPGLAFKAEAIVAPYDLVDYLGTGKHTGRECHIAYHNSLMVLLWSSLASRRVELMTYSLLQMPPAPAATTWVTYVRLHDDIGWAITDENAQAIGENAFLHRRFLNEFYSGQFPGSFASGEVFQFDPTTLEGRMSGMTASLAGLEKALAQREEDSETVIEGSDSDSVTPTQEYYQLSKSQQHVNTEVELAIRRIMLLYSVICSYGGIPLIYMGDELGLLNDPSYLQDPLKANDNRWLHRPEMDWKCAQKRHNLNTIPGRIFTEMQQLIQARKQTVQLHGAASVIPIWTDNNHVFAYLRQHPATGKLLALCNFSEDPQVVSVNLKSLEDPSRSKGLETYVIQDVRQLTRPILNMGSSEANQQVWLEPYQVLWLVAVPESQNTLQA